MARVVGLVLLKRGTDRRPDIIERLYDLIRALGDGELPTPPDRPDLPDRPYEPDPGEMGRPIVVPEGAAPVRLSDEIRRNFPRDQWVNAARVAYHESGWKHDAIRDTLDRAGGVCSVPIGTLPDGTPIVSEQSVGYFQINVCAHGGDVAYWEDLENNVRYAGMLYESVGWAAWFWTARYLEILGE